MYYGHATTCQGETAILRRKTASDETKEKESNVSGNKKNVSVSSILYYNTGEYTPTAGSHL